MQALIAGGGVAGAAAACLLGPAATLIERTNAPHDKICGEFLSWEAQAYLTRLGIDPAALGAHPISHVRLVHRDRVATAALPFTGLGLSRRVLDEALLTRAAARGATVLRGASVRSADGTALDVVGQGVLRADRLYLATGKYDLRGLRRTPDAPGTLVGLKMYFRLAPAQQAALAGHIEILLFPGGYAGLQMVEGGRANLCLLLARDRMAGQSCCSIASTLSHPCPAIRSRASSRHSLARPPSTICSPA